MVQLSFFSAEATEPKVADLAGLLCCQGQVVGFARSAARLTVVVDEVWRVRALALECARRGVEAELGVTERRDYLLRTAFRIDLSGLADSWTRDGAKCVPPGFTLAGAALRLWALACGRWVEGGYLLALDPGAQDTHEDLAAAMAHCGVAPTVVGVRGGGPGLRVSGRRRLARLAELVGMPETGGSAAHWPQASPARGGTLG